MKVRLKLTRDEYRGVATIVQNCCNALRGVDFESVQYRDCLAELLLKLARRMLASGGRGTLTLTDLEALVLHNCLGEAVQLFGPYEMGLGYRLLGEIDRQRMERLGQLRMTLEGTDGDYIFTRQQKGG